MSDVATQLKRLRVAVHKLRELGFDDAVIATDHGFFINAHAGPGDVGNKPPGDWVTCHDRSLIGEGSSDVRNFAVPSEHVGIRGGFSRFAGPKGMVAYSAGVSYFHGGASLQECIVPVIAIRLSGPTEQKAEKVNVEISYKSKKVTNPTSCHRYFDPGGRRNAGVHAGRGGSAHRSARHER